MVFEQAVAEVQQICGWRTDKVSEIQNALRFAQAQREQPGRSFPWFLKGFSLIATIVNQPIYSLPADYIQDLDNEREGVVYAYTGTLFASRPIFLKKQPFQILQQKFLGVWPSSGTSTSDVLVGRPTEYTLDTGSLYLYPIPDAVYSLIWNYWKRADSLGIGLENLWLANAPWLLIGDAAWKISKDLGYKEGQETAATLIAKAEQDLFKANVHRQEAGRKRSMGSRL